MNENTVVEFERPDGSEDALTTVIREGAQQLLAAAVEAEVELFIGRHQDSQSGTGRRRLVRNGYLPEREVQTGIGGVKVKVPRVRDRGGSDQASVQYRSGIVPPYLRRSRSVEELLPLLYLKGVSTGDFSEALSALVGPDAPGLSSNTISRLKRKWSKEYDKWSQRDLSGKQYLYVWADGVHCNVRLDDARLCLLVLIGTREDGRKELIAVEEGYRESEQSWIELLSRLRARGLAVEPKLAIGDGALGFWKALAKIFGNTRQQRCWMHKMGNVLNRLPKAVQPKAKTALQQIWLAETREAAHAAFDAFLETYAEKYPKATQTLAKDREVLLAFYDFPAEQWAHLRTTNPIESTFATVRLRTSKTRGCLSRVTMLAMVFKLCKSAEKRWRRLRGYKYLADVVRDVRFIDGIREDRVAA